MTLKESKLWDRVDQILDNLADSKDKRQTLHDMLKTTVENAERRGAHEFIATMLDELGESLTPDVLVVQVIEEILNPSSPDVAESTTPDDRLRQACSFFRASMEVLKNAK